MTDPLSSSSARSTHIPLVGIGSFFGDLVSTISGLFTFRNSVQDREDLSIAHTWIKHQTHTVSVIPSSASVRTLDPLESFLQIFISNLAVKTFEISVVDKIKKLISNGMSSAVNKQSDEIIKYLVLENEKSVPDLKRPEVVHFINALITHLLEYPNISEFTNDDMFTIRLFQASSSIEGLRYEGVPEERIHVLIKELGIKLGKNFLKSDRFKKAFGGGVFNALKPIVEKVLKNELPEISPTVKLFADMGSHFIAQRINTLYQSLNIPDILDTTIIHLNEHVKGYMEADKTVPFSLLVFKEQPRCHSLTKSMIEKNKVSDNLKSFFEEFTTTCLNYILDEHTLKQFVHDLKNIKPNLLKGVTDPFVINIVDILLQEENELILNQAILALKPLILPMLSTYLATSGLKKIFPQDRIYKVIFDGLAPPIYNLMRRLIIQQLVPEMLKEEQFMKLFAQFCKNSTDNDLIIAHVKTFYQKKFLTSFFGVTTPVPQEITDQILPALEKIKLLLDKKGEGETYQARLNKYLNQPYKDNGPAAYGELIMNTVLGIPGGLTDRLFNREVLQTLLTRVFLDGVGNLRGWEIDDKNMVKKINPFNGPQVLFNLLEKAIEPYKDPKEVETFLAQSSEPWTNTYLEGRIKKEAAILSDLLFKVISLSGRAGQVIAIGIDYAGLTKQLEIALSKLFTHNIVNYNIYFILLDILQKQIPK